MNVRLLSAGLLLVAFSSCSIQKLAMRRVADALSTGDSTVFAGESDTTLMGEALPFALKLYESLLDSVDDSPQLYLATGRAFVLYARAYVQMPAEMLPQERFDERVSETRRAKALYNRALRYILRGLDLRHPGLASRIFQGEQWQKAVAEAGVQDAPWLYWGGLAWMGAFSTDTFDFEMLLRVPRAAAMIGRVLELDDAFDDGGAHEFFITYYGSLPPDLGGSDARARAHYEKALALSRGHRASAHVALATALSVKNQDVKEFRALLEKALAVDLDGAPGSRLVNALAQKQASWLLAHVEDFFVEGDGR
jgi:predicted anti-sigma-YlaC factor YlaD